jgi:hypothetical protein
MNRFYAYALCAGLACFLAVVYTLLQIDWAAPEGAPAAPAAQAGIQGGLPR